MKKYILMIMVICSACTMFSCGKEFENGKSSIDDLPDLGYQDRDFTFSHPCMLHTGADFEYVRGKVDAGQQPWLMGYERLAENRWAQKTYTPNPKEDVERPGIGQYRILTDDGAAAYQLALMWKLTDDEDYAKASIAVLNAWAKTNKSLSGSEDILMAGFGGYQYANAAEIMRGYDGWKTEDFNTFKKWMLDVFYPICYSFLTEHKGNPANKSWTSWDLPAMNTILAIGILCDDSEKVNMVLRYFYNGGGAGCIENTLVAWHDDPDGNVERFAQSMEMGRDQGHATLVPPQHGYLCQMMLNATGIDLFAYNDDVILGLCEYTAKYNLESGIYPDMPYTPYNSGLEGWHNIIAPDGQGAARPGWELIYNHYKVKGKNPYYSKAFAHKMRPEGGGEGSGSSDDMGFGTLMYTREPIEAGEDGTTEP